MKKSFLFLLPLFLLACQTKEQFTVSGTITGSDGEMLYLEQMAVDGLLMLDSVRLSPSEEFTFKQARPAYPELYRLRIGKRYIVLAIDSTEQITVTGEITQPEITGSPKSVQIKELRTSLQNNSLEEHKAFARNIILSDPRSIVAYYALLQSKNQHYVLDIYNKQDRVCYQAVATSFNAFMPESKRSKALYKAVSEVLQQEREAKHKLALQEFFDGQENAFLDINLPDENGNIQSLSQYKGKVILLDFSAIEMERSTAYLFELKDLYHKFHARGLEIYQVSGDSDKGYWQNSARNLPWTTVRSEYGVQDACYRLYNVQVLPTMFLFNRKGEVLARFADFADLEKAIEKCLK